MLEVDAKTLAAQLNRSGTDLPGAVITSWLAWIRCFDFEVRHVPGTKHTAADGLSRRPRTLSDDLDEGCDEDIDDFVATELSSLRVMPVSLTCEGPDGESMPAVLEGEYSAKSHRIANYLATLERPEELTRQEYRKLQKEATKYQLKGRHLFRRASKNLPARRIIDAEDDRRRILEALHDQSGHKGREGTYSKVNSRYWWEGLYEGVTAYVKSCEECQRRAKLRTEEALHFTASSGLWEKIGVDIVHMQARGKGRFKYLIVARDDLSGWVEAKALVRGTSEAVAKFLWEDVVCRHGCFGKMVIDGGPENKDLVKAFAERYGIKRVQISAYHPQANGMVERGHKPIVDALAKMTSGGEGNWVDYLHAVLWADRCTVRQSTGYSPFFLICGRDPVLPIELDIPTWRVLPWDEVHDTKDLLALRARQIQRRDEDLEEAVAHLERRRMAGKEDFDDRHRIRAEKDIVEGDLVLLYDSAHAADMSTAKKLRFRWLGPYRVHQVIQPQGTYILKELDGVLLSGTIAGNRLKPFVVRRAYRKHVSASASASGSPHGTEGSASHEDIEEVLAEDSVDEEMEEEANLEEASQGDEYGEYGEASKGDEAYIPSGESFAVVV